VPDFTSALTGDVRGARIGVPRVLINDGGVDPEVSNAIKAALDVLVARGASLVDIDLPHAGAAIPVYYLIATAEASSNLARYDGVRYGYRSPFDSAQGRSVDGREELYDMRAGGSRIRPRGQAPNHAGHAC
jgi:aspartyl-tRNA(Asn)/glutamyl-tRNA(Gln) amidotransferase subunit A